MQAIPGNGWTLGLHPSHALHAAACIFPDVVMLEYSAGLLATGLCAGWVHAAMCTLLHACWITEDCANARDSCCKLC